MTPVKGTTVGNGLPRVVGRFREIEFVLEKVLRCGGYRLFEAELSAL